MSDALAEKVRSSGQGIAAFEVTVQQADGARAVVAVRGELDLSNTDRLTGVLDNQLAIGHRYVRLDLSRLDFMDACGLDAIVRAHNSFLAAHGNLVLTGISRGIEKLLAVTHLDGALFVADNHEPRQQLDDA